jgi:hypothetical protein
MLVSRIFETMNINFRRTKKERDKLEDLQNNGKVVKCTPVQALRLCTGRTAHRGSTGITLAFHDHSTRRG